MLARDLRIGNWVRHQQTWSYRQDDEDMKEFDFQFNESDWYSVGKSILSLNDISPIPLTEEWLLKFGFSKYSDWQYGSYFVSKFADGYFFRKLSNENIKVQYVHQLQNLYFALTGEELTIKENATSI